MNIYPNIAIVGPSGFGKSSSLRNLNPETTAIINIEKKTLPFKGFKNFKYCDEANNYGEALSKLIDFGTKDAIEVIVLDSFTELDEVHTSLCRKTNKGYDVWNKHNEDIRDFIKASKSLPLPKFVVFLAGDEIVQVQTPEGGHVSQRRIKVAGKELEGTIDKAFTIVLWCEIFKDKTGNPQYKFRTNTDGVCSAKTPMELYTPGAETLIDNDLNQVINKIKAYYK